MAIPVARVHLAVAHAALPALLPTPPVSVWKKMLPPLLPTPPCPCVSTVVLPKPLATKPGRADADERWDARKTTTKPASAQPSASSSSSSRGSANSTAGHGSPRKNATTSPPLEKTGRADSAERWDAHKKAAARSPASSPSSSSSDTSSFVSSSKWSAPISRATSADRWDMDKHKKRCLTSQADEQLDDGEISSTGSNGIDDTDEEEEEIVWKPRRQAMFAGPGFVVAAPEPSMLPMPTAAFLVPVA